jgi:hypothetical protein
MGLKFRIIAKLGHAKHFGPNESNGLENEKRIYVQSNTHRRGSMYGNIKGAWGL